MKPIVRNINNNVLYEYLGENIFMNLATGKSGKVSDETARKTFKVNLEATIIVNDYPIIKDLISKLGLKFIKDEVDSLQEQGRQ